MIVGQGGRSSKALGVRMLTTYANITEKPEPMILIQNPGTIPKLLTVNDSGCELTLKHYPYGLTTNHLWQLIRC